ncbi:protein moonraker isoform X1 [Trichomycterus rosablanca]|uniref:protein moonraker isoform X1 n=1 Tax=Trichomycterus rosablanca TaxID=2290929 RepID=UPI002F35506C
MSINDQMGFPTTQGSKHTGSWVNKKSLTSMTEPQTQLLFNLAMPTTVLNRATRVGSPAPIVIEKLVSFKERQDDCESCSSSLRFSVVSEERLQDAVKLAKRDLRRRRQESVNSSSHKTKEKSPNPENTRNDQDVLSSNEKQRTGGPKTQTKSCSQVLVYTPQMLSVHSMAEQCQSPPTKESGLKASSESQLSREIRKLQRELASYVQRIEQLVNKERLVETVEPDEQRRIEIRKQEQAARSARIIYVLQQQVKEIQEDLDKLRSQSAKPTKKCRAVDRLAAAHRGAVRAMQAFINQLSDPAESRVPAQCKELGQLIRQLSLCSAKVEVDQGSAVPETTLDILQKLEMLDSALSKQESQREKEPRMQSVSPVRSSSPKVRGISMSPPRASRNLAGKPARGPKKSSAPKKVQLGTGRYRRVERLSDQERSKILKTGIQKLVHRRELREGEVQRRPEVDFPKPPTGAAYKSKLGVHVCDAKFQQPTVSSRLRESQLPQREASVPWIPTSPHSPDKQRKAVPSRPEPRCLFSPGKSSSLPTGVQTTNVQPKDGGQETSSTDSSRKTNTGKLRLAWQDTMRENRQKELNHITEEETELVNRTRLDVDLPTHLTKQAELAGGERIQPLFASVQTAVTADVATEDLLVKENQQLFQEPLLENMLLRMEQIEKDEEDVCRRFAMISYDDPLLWEINTGALRKNDSSRPVTPQPIRLTRPVQRPSCAGDIILQRPVETGVVSESAMQDEDPPALVPSSASGQVQQHGALRLSVPSRMQDNIYKYREDHDSYLRLVSHEAVGSFNPWAIAEGLAEELLNEALADVATEFQDVCGEYAEAIFTSEFLQPIKPRSPSVS